MKKFFITMLAVLVSCTAMAQLNVQYESSKDDVIVKGGVYGSLRQSKDGYTLYVTDMHTGQSIIFVLGKDRSSALQTLLDMATWYNGAKNKSYIEVKDAIGRDYTLGKVGGNLFITTGDGEYIRKYYKDDVLTALFGSTSGPTGTFNTKGKHTANTPLIGYVTSTIIGKGIKRLE